MSRCGRESLTPLAALATLPTPPEVAMSVVSRLVALAALLAGCANLDNASGSTTDTAGGNDAKAACFVDAAADADVAAFQDVFQDPQYAITARQPVLGETVCPPVDHWWTMAATGGPSVFFIGHGKRHTAGEMPDDSYQVTTADEHTFHMAKPILWPGPGSHVHLTLLDANNKALVDPFFEYDLVP